MVGGLLVRVGEAFENLEAFAHVLALHARLEKSDAGGWYLRAGERESGRGRAEDGEKERARMGGSEVE